jgi:hypothetical protein
VAFSVEDVDDGATEDDDGDALRGQFIWRELGEVEIISGVQFIESGNFKFRGRISDYKYPWTRIPSIVPSVFPQYLAFFVITLNCCFQARA